MAIETQHDADAVRHLDVVPVDESRWRTTYRSFPMPPPFNMVRHAGKGRITGMVDQMGHPFNGEAVRLTRTRTEGRFHVALTQHGKKRIITGPCMIDGSQLDRLDSAPLRAVSADQTDPFERRTVFNIEDRANLGLAQVVVPLAMALVENLMLLLTLVGLAAIALVWAMLHETPIARMGRPLAIGWLFFGFAFVALQWTGARGFLFYLLVIPGLIALFVPLVWILRGYSDDVLPGDRLD
ncbi:hypothetical protein [Sphingomicrobium marinum]|uniref:hypothetical protein n=1 Tax=Sphingomicrobium marinum TaxID=1227950 RepID=UPI00223FF963|nr:hypothetical protein [Sphingomicrobium marinum]